MLVGQPIVPVQTNSGYDAIYEAAGAADDDDGDGKSFLLGHC